jgi:hypothetical protein
MRKLGLAVVMLLAGLGTVAMAADFDGDGTGDIAVFRASTSLWSVRNVTRIYFGSAGDTAVPGDYDGSGTARAAIFRQADGLWSVRDLTRIYFGSAGDVPKIGDYNGDGTEDFGLFRSSAGLWAVSGITRVYFGSDFDTAIAPGKASVRGLLRTGQTFSEQTGDDGYLQKGKALSYTDNGDGTITDNATGLMWAKDGNGAGCNFGNFTDWSSAVNWAGTLEWPVVPHYRDWRLPNRRELESLVDAGTNSPAINPVFINTKLGYYWSSTSRNNNPTGAWVVDFGDGGVVINDKTGNYCVRAVRGGR